MATCGFSRWVTGDRLRAGQVITTAAFLLWGSIPSTAIASDPSEDELNKQGVEARKRNDDAVALEFFRRAYQVSHSPRAAAQVGLAEIALGRWEDAEVHLDEALRSPTDPWIQKNDKILKDTMERVRNQFGTLQVLGGPPGAEVVIEGRILGTLPMNGEIRVRIGERRFDVRAPGHAGASRTVIISAANPTCETVELSPFPVATAASTIRGLEKVSSAVGGRAPPETALATAPAPNAEPVPPARTNRGRLRTIGLVLGGLGLAAVGVGVAFGIEARAAGDNNSQVGNTFDPNADARGKRYETLQYVGLGTGAALVTAGIVTFVLGLGPDQEGGDKRASLLPLSGGGAAAAWSVRF